MQRALGAWCRTVLCERPQQCRGGESEMTWCDKRLRPNPKLLLWRSVSAEAQKAQLGGAEDAEVGCLSLHLKFRARCPWGRTAAHNEQLLLVHVLSNGTSASLMETFGQREHEKWLGNNVKTSSVKIKTKQPMPTKSTRLSNCSHTLQYRGVCPVLP